MDISIKFGKRMKRLRLDKGMSQGNLAKILSVHPTYISQIERGIWNISLKNVEKIARALGVSVNNLLK